MMETEMLPIHNDGHVLMLFQGGRESVAYTIVTVNKPPYNGTCTVFPKYGINHKTMFTLDCEDWVDDSGIDMYEYYGELIAGIY